MDDDVEDKGDVDGGNADDDDEDQKTDSKACSMYVMMTDAKNDSKDV